MRSIILCIAIGYIFGMFLTAEFVVRVRKGKNIRDIGSGNPGMANVMVNVGKTEGILVLIGDILKTAVAVAVAWVILRTTVGFRQIALWTGFGVILGHDFPVTRRFRGGKGVTSTCSWLILSMPLWGLPSSIIGGIVVLVSKRLDIGAIIIPLVAIPFAWIFGGVEEGILTSIAAILMFIRNNRSFFKGK